MTIHQDAFGSSAGSPNLEVLQYLQDNWGRTEIGQALRVDKVILTATSGTAGIAASNIPVGAEIIDVVVHCNSSNGGGTATLRVGGGGANITDAITMATEDAITRASTIDQTYNIVGSDGVEVVTNADADQGDVYIHYIKQTSS